MSMTGMQPSKQAEPQQRSSDELKLLQTLGQLAGRKLSEQEQELALEQARALGEV